MKISYGGANVRTASGRGGAENIANGDGYGDVEGLAGECPPRRVKYAAFLKLLMFSLFIGIAQGSHESTNRSVMKGTPLQRGQATVHEYADRLLGEPPMDYEEVYGTFKKEVLEKLACDEEQCQTIKSSVKSYFDRIKWNMTDQQNGKESEMGDDRSNNALDTGNEERKSYKYAGIFGSLIDLVLNYNLTSVTILIIVLAYFKSGYLPVAMGVIILLNIFWELESLNKKLKIL
ncbi:hypothetical protein C922_02259 [Plasmodium inui San Antonio 1]|uniref:Pv-fam-h protein n=1 Tax=Plasmodium inui San Antonio 1 TaxID=1237626 RepID=W7A8F9_9APIC|nr:hypothetical protein C922_02259 [Plasmodium inui San Antonio 1]EUD67553.1 hypothetical protein C922_02259 [Plasmodium inui San Antonio 1]